MLNSVPEVYLSRLPYIEDLLMEALGVLPTRAEVARLRSGTLLSAEGPVTASMSDPIRRSARAATCEEEAAEAFLLNPWVAAQWYEDQMEHVRRSRPFLARQAGETVEGDNVMRELLELVKRGDEAGFRALAGCVMPAEQVHDCWDGVRARLGLGDG